MLSGSRAKAPTTNLASGDGAIASLPVNHRAGGQTHYLLPGDPMPADIGPNDRVIQRIFVEPGVELLNPDGSPCGIEVRP